MGSSAGSETLRAMRGPRLSGVRPMPTMTIHLLLAFRKQQRHDEARAPFRSAFGLVRVPASATRETDHLSADLRDLRVHDVDGHGPLLVFPVIRRLTVECECASALELLCDERLQEGIADVRAAARACERLDVIDERARRPAGFGLLEHQETRTRAPFLGA